MTSSQWIAAAILLLVFGGLLFAFLRHGSRIKPDPDRRTEDWRKTTQGGSGG